MNVKNDDRIVSGRYKKFSAPSQFGDYTMRGISFAPSYSEQVLTVPAVNDWFLGK